MPRVPCMTEAVCLAYRRLLDCRNVGEKGWVEACLQGVSCRKDLCLRTITLSGNSRFIVQRQRLGEVWMAGLMLLESFIPSSWIPGGPFR